MTSLEDRITALEARNQRVDLDKKWETSLERRLTILLCTYIVIGIFLFGINAPKPWINAIVPSIGFTLSTLTLRWLKLLWLKHYNDR